MGEAGHCSFYLSFAFRVWSLLSASVSSDVELRQGHSGEEALIFCYRPCVDFSRATARQAPRGGRQCCFNIFCPIFCFSSPALLQTTVPPRFQSVFRLRLIRSSATAQCGIESMPVAKDSPHAQIETAALVCRNSIQTCGSEER